MAPLLCDGWGKVEGQRVMLELLQSGLQSGQASTGFPGLPRAAHRRRFGIWKEQVAEYHWSDLSIHQLAVPVEKESGEDTGNYGKEKPEPSSLCFYCLGQPLSWVFQSPVCPVL